MTEASNSGSTHLVTAANAFAPHVTLQISASTYDTKGKGQRHSIGEEGANAPVN